MGGVVELFFQVRAPDAKNPDGGYVPVSNANPLPVHGLALAAASAPSSFRTGSDIAIDGLLASILVTPTATQVGPITISNGGPPITIFAGGTLPSLVPFRIDIGLPGAWSIVAGSGLSVLVMGDFA